MAALDMFTICADLFLPFLSARADIDLKNVCTMDDPIVTCTWTVPRVYRSFEINSIAARITFDRLTESQLSLDRLPQVDLVSIQGAIYEHRPPYSLVIGNRHPITVELIGEEPQPPQTCPADVSQQTPREDVDTTTSRSSTKSTNKIVTTDESVSEVTEGAASSLITKLAETTSKAMRETTAGTSDNREDYDTGNYLLGDSTVASSSFNVKTPISSFTIKTTPISSFPVEASVSYFNVNIILFYSNVYI